MENASTSSRCRLTSPKETKVCPVCDSSIDVDAQTCPSCQTDLTLFDLGGTSSDPVDVHVKDGRSIDDILASIMDGKEDQPEIFETLKSVARETPGGAGTIATEKSAPTVRTAREIGEQFLCPVCETLVAADAILCPGCGAEFSEGASAEYECPVCKSPVSADADLCPSCGARFAEEAPVGTRVGRTLATELLPPGRGISPSASYVPEGSAPPSPLMATRTPVQSRIEQLRRTRQDSLPRIPSGDRKLLYRELPKLVNEVKPLLVSAKRIGLEIDDGKRIINDAIQAGKGRDIERAVALIAEARRVLDIAFVEFIGVRVEAFLEEVRAAKGDAAVQSVTPRLLEAVGRMEAGDYDAAWDILQGTLGGFESAGKDFREARKALDDGDRLVRDVQAIGMDVRGVEQLLHQGRESLDHRDVARALRLGRQAQDRLRRDVPTFVDQEMRKARNDLLDLKMKGLEVSRPIGILKEASAFVKEEAWSDALRRIRDFYVEIRRKG